MEGESAVTRSITDEFHFFYMQGDQMESEIGVTPRSIIDEIHSWDIQVDHIEGESGVTRSVID